MIDIYDEEEEEVTYIKRKNCARDVDLSEINLDDEIKMVAQNIYKTYGNSTHKGDNRKKILYACFYLAGIRLDRPFLPNQLMAILKLDSKQFSGCERKLSEFRRKTGDKPKVFTPLDIVKIFLDKNDEYKNHSYYAKIEKIWNKYNQKIDIKKLNIRAVAVYLISKTDDIDRTIKQLCDFYYITEDDYDQVREYMDDISV